MSKNFTKNKESNIMKRLLVIYSEKDLINYIVSNYVKKHKIKTKNKLILTCIKQNKIQTIPTDVKLETDFISIQKMFEYFLDATKRKKHGVVYTPNIIVDYIVNKTVKKNTVTILDPSCGTGVFLISAVKRLHKLTGKPVSEIIENNIYGADILADHIKYCKILFTLYMLSTGEDKKSLSFNLRVCNSLIFDWKKHHPHGFDVIIGNPPYVRIQDIPEYEKEELQTKWLTCKGSYNLYFAFFELGMAILNKKGVLGYITANSFFTSFAGKTLRKWLQDNRYVENILDFTHLILFNATSYTCVIFMNKKNKTKIGYNYINKYEDLNNIYKIKFSDNFYKDIKYDKWRLLKSDERKIIQKIENTGRPLGKIADIQSGIATLKDKIYFVPYSSEKLIKKSYNGTMYFIENNITRNIIKIPDVANGSKKANPTHKIIFPYRRENGRYKPIPEDVMKKKYPKCYEYLCSVKDVLASRDKGKKQYKVWYSYGRNQGFEICCDKLLTPTFSNEPRFVLDNGDSLFCNGYAITNSKVPLQTLQKILNSEIMKYYITKTSVFIEGSYACFQKNFIERFGIPDFTDSEINNIYKTDNKDELNDIIMEKYNIFNLLSY